MNNKHAMLNANKLACLLLTLILILTAIPSVAGIEEKDDNNTTSNDTQETNDKINKPLTLIDNIKSKIKERNTIISRFAGFFERLIEKFPRLSTSPAITKLMNLFGASTDGDPSDDNGDGNNGSDGGNDNSGNQNNGDNPSTDVEYEENPTNNPAKNQDNFNGDGNATIVPESGHIWIKGNGFVEIDTDLNINDEFYVTLSGNLYMSTDVNQVDIYWDFTTGYFEIDATAFEEDGEAFVQFGDFIIEIQENNTNKILSFSVGFLSIDAYGHVIFNEGLTEGMIDFEGLFKLSDLAFSFTNTEIADISLSASISIFLQESADIHAAWDEEGFTVDAYVSIGASGGLYVEIYDFILEFDDILVTADLIGLGGSGSFSIQLDGNAEIDTEQDYSRFDLDEQGGSSGNDESSDDSHQGHEPGDFHDDDVEVIDGDSSSYPSSEKAGLPYNGDPLMDDSNLLSTDDIVDNMTGPPDLPPGLKDVDISINGVTVKLENFELKYQNEQIMYVGGLLQLELGDDGSGSLLIQGEAGCEFLLPFNIDEESFKFIGLFDFNGYLSGGFEVVWSESDVDLRLDADISVGACLDVSYLYLQLDESIFSASSIHLEGSVDLDASFNLKYCDICVTLSAEVNISLTDIYVYTQPVSLNLEEFVFKGDLEFELEDTYVSVVVSGYLSIYHLRFLGDETSMLAGFALPGFTILGVLSFEGSAPRWDFIIEGCLGVGIPGISVGVCCTIVGWFGIDENGNLCAEFEGTGGGGGAIDLGFMTAPFSMVFGFKGNLDWPILTISGMALVTIVLRFRGENQDVGEFLHNFLGLGLDSVLGITVKNLYMDYDITVVAQVVILFSVSYNFETGEYYVLFSMGERFFVYIDTLRVYGHNVKIYGDGSEDGLLSPILRNWSIEMKDISFDGDIRIRIGLTGMDFQLNEVYGYWNNVTLDITNLWIYTTEYYEDQTEQSISINIQGIHADWDFNINWERMGPNWCFVNASGNLDITGMSISISNTTTNSNLYLYIEELKIHIGEFKVTSTKEYYYQEHDQWWIKFESWGSVTIENLLFGGETGADTTLGGIIESFQIEVGSIVFTWNGELEFVWTQSPVSEWWLNSGYWFGGTVYEGYEYAEHFVEEGRMIRIHAHGDFTLNINDVDINIDFPKTEGGEENQLTLHITNIEIAFGGNITIMPGMNPGDPPIVMVNGYIDWDMTGFIDTSGYVEVNGEVWLHLYYNEEDEWCGVDVGWYGEFTAHNIYLNGSILGKDFNLSIENWAGHGLVYIDANLGEDGYITIVNRANSTWDKFEFSIGNIYAKAFQIYGDITLSDFGPYGSYNCYSENGFRSEDGFGFYFNSSGGVEFRGLMGLSNIGPLDEYNTIPFITEFILEPGTEGEFRAIYDEETGNWNIHMETFSGKASFGVAIVTQTFYNQLLNADGTQEFEDLIENSIFLTIYITIGESTYDGTDITLPGLPEAFELLGDLNSSAWQDIFSALAGILNGEGFDSDAFIQGLQGIIDDNDIQDIVLFLQEFENIVNELLEDGVVGACLVINGEKYCLGDIPSGNGASCFLEGTQIAMADGTTKNIEDIQTGDKVKSLNPQTGETITGEVTEIFHHTPQEMTDYYLIINDDLKVTPNHPLYVNGEYILAGELKIGDKFGEGVKTIEKVYQRVPTYNFEVTPYHNYEIIWGTENGIVHNAAQEEEESYSGDKNSCFLAGTKILMYDGTTKSIENIRVGDLVLSIDVTKLDKIGNNDGNFVVDVDLGPEDIFVPGKVVNVFHHTPEEMGDYYLIINDELKVTPNHPVYVNYQFIPAGQLKVGDPFGEGVESIQKVYQKVPTYNFEVEKYHNYKIVWGSGGEDLVHNMVGHMTEQMNQHQGVTDQPIDPGMFPLQLPRGFLEYLRFLDWLKNGGFSGDKGGGGNSCFLEGTQIAMADGTTKNIEDITIGDKVKSLNPQTGETIPGEVTEIFHHTPQEMTDHYLIINNDLKVTPNHPLYINGQYIPAGELKIGDPFGEGIKTIQKVYQRVPTYNFEVTPYHNYEIIWGTGNGIAHNANQEESESYSSDKYQNSCFLEGTDIAMADGSVKPIENIEKGDLVNSYDFNKEEWVPGEVVNVFHHSSEDMTDYYLIINNELRITPNHPVFVNGEFIKADELNIGDIFGGNKITSIEKIYEKVPTYNFEVEKYHNYEIVWGSASSLVHNMEDADYDSTEAENHAIINDKNPPDTGDSDEPDDDDPIIDNSGPPINEGPIIN